MNVISFVFSLFCKSISHLESTAPLKSLRVSGGIEKTMEKFNCVTEPELGGYGNEIQLHSGFVQTTKKDFFQTKTTKRSSRNCGFKSYALPELGMPAELSSYICNLVISYSMMEATFCAKK